jgi:hypothetical protein
MTMQTIRSLAHSPSFPALVSNSCAHMLPNLRNEQARAGGTGPEYTERTRLTEEEATEAGGDAALDLPQHGHRLASDGLGRA